MNMKEYNDSVLRNSDKWLTHEPDKNTDEYAGQCELCDKSLFLGNARYEYRGHLKYADILICEDCFDSFNKLGGTSYVGYCLCCGIAIYTGDEYYTISDEDADEKDIICTECIDGLQYRED